MLCVFICSFVYYAQQTNGHLNMYDLQCFSWSCLHQWLDTRPNRQECPVCKAGISRDKVVPLYGRGNANQQDPRYYTSKIEACRLRILQHYDVQTDKYHQRPCSDEEVWRANLISRLKIPPRPRAQRSEAEDNTVSILPLAGIWLNSVDT